MILYQPQLVVVPTNDGNLFLHATTFFDTINIQPNGYKIKKKIKNGVLTVELYASANNNFSRGILKMRCVNPVVHHVDLGDAVQVDEEGNLDVAIEAIIYLVDSSRGSTSRSGGKKRRSGSKVVGKTSSTKDLKPKPS